MYNTGGQLFGELPNISLVDQSWAAESDSADVYALCKELLSMLEVEQGSNSATEGVTGNDDAPRTLRLRDSLDFIEELVVAVYFIEHAEEAAMNTSAKWTTSSPNAKIGYDIPQCGSASERNNEVVALDCDARAVFTSVGREKVLVFPMSSLQNLKQATKKHG
jgi:hypothetical protein